jgi:predicted aspartyl protease
MTLPFNPHHGHVLVHAQITGPGGSAPALLALDTGALETVVRPGILATVGIDLALASHFVQAITGSGTVNAPLVTFDKLSALGQDRSNFPVLAHTLPPSAGMDGLRGLDFFRGQTLPIDFRTGQITRASPLGGFAAAEAPPRGPAHC